jgi:predicted ribosome quality control (RQC) complex YloA/Tae2 family protein
LSVEETGTTWVAALEAMWSRVRDNKKRGETVLVPSRSDRLAEETRRWEKEIAALDDEVGRASGAATIDFSVLGALCDKRRRAREKLARACATTAAARRASPPKATTVLGPHRWYHDFCWWRLRDGTLVIGGRSAAQNEKIVRHHLLDHHYFLHTEEPGSGVFVVLNNKDAEADPVDLARTAAGVLAFSQAWKAARIGSVFCVRGSQVSKEAPSGESIARGGFMIRGERQWIRVDRLVLGYALTGDELVLAPYEIARQSPGPWIRLTPRTDRKRNSHKEIHRALRDVLGVIPPAQAALFPYPCYVASNS